MTSPFNPQSFQQLLQSRLGNANQFQNQNQNQNSNQNFRRVNVDEDGNIIIAGNNSNIISTGNDSNVFFYKNIIINGQTGTTGTTGPTGPTGPNNIVVFGENGVDPVVPGFESAYRIAGTGAYVDLATPLSVAAGVTAVNLQFQFSGLTGGTLQLTSLSTNLPVGAPFIVLDNGMTQTFQSNNVPTNDQYYIQVVSGEGLLSRRRFAARRAARKNQINRSNFVNKPAANKPVGKKSITNMPVSKKPVVVNKNQANKSVAKQLPFGNRRR